jgi:hypothetical protein
MDAAVGAAGDRQRERVVAQDGAQRARDLTLDGPPPRLDGPAEEVGAVVLKGEARSQTSSR